MADVWVGRISRGFEKLFNIKGGPSVVDVAHTVQSVFTIPTGLEERYLFGVESFAGGSAQAGVAANKSAFMIRNPLGSNVIAVIEKITVFTATSGQANMYVAGSNPADLANAVTNNSRADPRGRSVGTCVLSQDAPAVDPATGFNRIGVFQTTTAGSVDLIVTNNQEIVLLPQIALRLVIQPVNQNILWTCFWRERPIETSELT